MKETINKEDVINLLKSIEGELKGIEPIDLTRAEENIKAKVEVFLTLNK